MNHDHDSTASVTVPPHAPRGARFLGVVVVLALGGWIGVRVNEAVHAKKLAQAAQPASSAERAAPRETIRAHEIAWQSSVAIEGTLSPARETDLGFSVPGRLARVNAKVGSKVRAGEVLAALDSSQASAQARAAEAQIRAAKAQLALADDQSARTSQLLASGTLSEATGVQVDQQKALASAQLDAAVANRELARVVLQNHAIVAPFAGSITVAPSAPGAIVAPGVPIFHLAEVDVLRLVGTMNEADAPLVRTGDDVEVVAQGRTLHGKITAVLTTVDPATRRVRIEAEVPNDPAAPVLAGSFAKATAKGRGETKALGLPASVLRPGSQDEVIVAKGGALEARRIRFVTEGATLVVLDGLSQDEAVLAEPPPTLPSSAEKAR